MALLVLGCIASIASAITGVQSFYWSSHNGAVESSVTYWQGSRRWLALVYAAVFAITFYGIYRRFPLAWSAVSSFYISMLFGSFFRLGCSFGRSRTVGSAPQR